jgi:hypothetical protein
VNILCKSREAGAGDLNLGVINMYMVFKAIELNMITLEEE